MKAADISTLQQLVTAANDWRNAALTVDVELDVITARIKSQKVVLSWDETNSTWDIRTGDE